MPKPFASTSCIILSAGSSERMGTHKSLLKFDAEKSFIEKITETYLQVGVEQIIVVVTTELSPLLEKEISHLGKNVHLVTNHYPGLGRFYSLQRGVQHLKFDNYCFFQNIDNPFATGKLLGDLIIHKEKADVIIPAFQNRTGHPVLLSPAVAKDILLQNDPEIRIDQFLKRYNTLKVETSDPSILANINSHEEFLAAGFSL
ncbi:MAG: NTP transferase domain-containing protein [Bacteroidota bacterium]